ncbi:hypothetical protein A2U01_0044114, partial [Trifolium medium]|nr:hypothetical protein [Trifolium medium]
MQYQHRRLLRIGGGGSCSVEDDDERNIAIEPMRNLCRSGFQMKKQRVVVVVQGAESIGTLLRLASGGCQGEKASLATAAMTAALFFA